LAVLKSVCHIHYMVVINVLKPAVEP